MPKFARYPIPLPLPREEAIRIIRSTAKHLEGHARVAAHAAAEYRSCHSPSRGSMPSTPEPAHKTSES